MAFPSRTVSALSVVLILSTPEASSAATGDSFQDFVLTTVTKYCFDCHSGSDANGDADFSAFKSVADLEASFEVWESAISHLEAQTMPPEGEPQPTEEERNRLLKWFEQFLDSIEARPAVFRPRRLSVVEYRNTLRSVLGFDLEVAIIEAEQTVTERSMVVKLLPTDPPGRSGFKNDTHANPLTNVVWDQYSYLVDTGLEELFSRQRQDELEELTGPLDDGKIAARHVRPLLAKFITRVRRRPAESVEIDEIANRLADVPDTELVPSLKPELKAVLMSPSFIYRGLLITGERGQRQSVDQFELAERLSYFFWADMPDEQMMSLANAGSLTEPSVLYEQIDRMLASPKARSLAEVFATEWFTLNEIEHVSNNPPVMVALKSQPLDFLDYLFTEKRPLLELVDSRTAFVNPHTQRMYAVDAKKQMKRYSKQKGIEVEIVPNQRIQLEATTERGGLLTMPGILAMNRGPIIRGTWILERVLGEHLPEPPPDVGQVQPNRRGENLTFRQRFEQHRNNPSCAVCHDKIDPLGFALQSYDGNGQFLKSASYRPPKKKKGSPPPSDSKSKIDTSGRLPTGEIFEDIDGLKEILRTSRRRAVVRNIVERTMSYALCRKLEIFDRPTVEDITQQMIETEGTWHDLFHAIVGSVPFQETILSEG